MASVREAFEAKVDRAGEHHLWLGSRTNRGAGQIRIAGKLRTAIQVAWELENGEIPADHRVQACPDESLCVRGAHLTLVAYRSRKSTSGSTTRAERGSGSIQRVGDNKWKVTIDAGCGQPGTAPPGHSHHQGIQVRCLADPGHTERGGPVGRAGPSPTWICGDRR